MGFSFSRSANGVDTTGVLCSWFWLLSFLLIFLILPKVCKACGTPGMLVVLFECFSLASLTGEFCAEPPPPSFEW